MPACCSNSAHSLHTSSHEPSGRTWHSSTVSDLKQRQQYIQRPVSCSDQRLPWKAQTGSIGVSSSRICVLSEYALSLGTGEQRRESQAISLPIPQRRRKVYRQSAGCFSFLAYFLEVGAC